MNAKGIKANSENIKHSRISISSLKWSIGFVLLILMLVESGRGTDYVRQGFSICVKSVLPVLFPFALMSALICQTEPPELLARPLCRFFGISIKGVSALFSGLLSGFPVGAMAVGSLYKRGDIGKNEAERLLCFTNNPSCAFTVGVVGSVVLGSGTLGALLFIILTAVSVVTGRILMLLCKGKADEEYECANTIHRKATFSQAVGSTALSMLNVSGFIVAFSVVTGYLRQMSRPLGETISTLLCGIAELSNGVLSLTDACLSPQMKFILCGAFCAFSGCCVHMQVSSALADSDISMKKYFISKAAGAVATTFICLVISPLLF